MSRTALSRTLIRTLVSPITLSGSLRWLMPMLWLLTLFQHASYLYNEQVKMIHPHCKNAKDINILRIPFYNVYCCTFNCISTWVHIAQHNTINYSVYIFCHYLTLLWWLPLNGISQDVNVMRSNQSTFEIVW